MHFPSQHGVSPLLCLAIGLFLYLLHYFESPFINNLYGSAANKSPAKTVLYYFSELSAPFSTEESVGGAASFVDCVLFR